MRGEHEVHLRGPESRRLGRVGEFCLGFLKGDGLSASDLEQFLGQGLCEFVDEVADNITDDIDE